MRLVIDCNVVISAALTPGTSRRVTIEAVRAHTILISDAILSEYRSVAARPKFRRCRDLLDEIIATIEAVAVAVPTPTTQVVLPDPADAAYLATAIAGRAEALITGNTRHFTGHCGDDLQLLTPRQFLDRDR